VTRRVRTPRRWPRVWLSDRGPAGPARRPARRAAPLPRCLTRRRARRLSGMCGRWAAARSSRRAGAGSGASPALASPDDVADRTARRCIRRWVREGAGIAPQRKYGSSIEVTAAAVLAAPRAAAISTIWPVLPPWRSWLTTRVTPRSRYIIRWRMPVWLAGTPSKDTAGDERGVDTHLWPCERHARHREHGIARRRPPEGHPLLWLHPRGAGLENRDQQHANPPGVSCSPAI
jgi:hypothetical protein